MKNYLYLNLNNQGRNWMQKTRQPCKDGDKFGESQQGIQHTSLLQMISGQDWVTLAHFRGSWEEDGDLFKLRRSSRLYLTFEKLGPLLKLSDRTAFASLRSLVEEERRKIFTLPTTTHSLCLSSLSGNNSLTGVWNLISFKFDLWPIMLLEFIFLPVVVLDELMEAVSAKNEAPVSDTFVTWVSFLSWKWAILVV